MPDSPITHRSFVSYIDRTREYYAAQGYGRPYRWAHHASVPFANLEKPLAELTKRFREAGEDPPTIRVMTRSGDTTASERRRMLRQPPEILITTPESLNILLTSKSGRTTLRRQGKLPWKRRQRNQNFWPP